MGRVATCPFCGQPINKDYPTKKYQNRTYHADCYKKLCASLYAQSGEKQSQSSVDEIPAETPEQKLYNKICVLFNITELNGMLVSQVKKMMADYNCTYSGIEKSLDYYYGVLKNAPDLQYGIGIVPYIYAEAKSFYERKAKLEKSTVPITKPQSITVRHTERTDYHNPFEIDINSL